MTQDLYHDHKLPVSEVLKSMVGFFGLRLGDQPRYEVVERIGDVEIREYKPYLVATTKVEGKYETATQIGFQRLADYIFGKNTENKHLTMTAPVFQEREAAVFEDEDFSSTIPVIREMRGTGWLMSFVLPTKFTFSTAPRPIDDHIVVSESAPGLVAVLSFSGTPDKDTVEEKITELNEWVIRHEKYDAMSEPRSAQYDAPFAIPFLRKNEIHINVAPKHTRH